MRNAIVAALVAALVIVVTGTTAAKPADFCQAHPDHRHCAAPTPTATATPTPAPTPTPTPAATPTPTATATATPTVAPTPTPTVAPTPTPTSAPPPAGWTLAFTDDFNTWDPTRYRVYSPTWPDTREQQQAGAGSFYSAPITASGGVLDVAITYRRVAAFIPGNLDLAGMRAEFRARADSMHGYKGVPLLWPASGVWPRDGEINWPEGNFDGPISGFVHHQGATSGSDQDSVSAPAGTTWQQWHTYVIEWVSGTSVDFYMDGARVGGSTSRVPNTPMHLVMQFESALDGGVRDPAVSGHVQVDYVRLWSRSGATPTPTPTVAPTPTPTVAPTPAPTPTPAPGSTVVVAVGDVHGEGSDADAVATSGAVTTINPAAILGLGDYQYTTGSCSNIMTSGRYNTDWGRHQAKMYPTFGPTHDYDQGAANAAGYFNGQCSGQSTRSAGALAAGGTQDWNEAYSFNVGGWHVINLPSLCFRYSGCDTAAITSWLRADLAADTHACELAFWHEPYWTSPTSEHARTTAVRPWVQELYNAGVDLTLNGHQHFYERFFPQNMSDQRDDARGIASIISGTGGISHYVKTSTAANEAAYNASTYGVLRLTLSAGGYAFQFVPVQGGTFSDSGSATCH